MPQPSAARRRNSASQRRQLVDQHVGQHRPVALDLAQVPLLLRRTGLVELPLAARAVDLPDLAQREVDALRRRVRRRRAGSPCRAPARRRTRRPRTSSGSCCRLAVRRRELAVGGVVEVGRVVERGEDLVTSCSSSSLSIALGQEARRVDRAAVAGGPQLADELDRRLPSEEAVDRLRVARRSWSIFGRKKSRAGAVSYVGPDRRAQRAGRRAGAEPLPEALDRVAPGGVVRRDDADLARWA